MQTQIFGSCSRYIQGYGVIRDINKYVGWMGNRFLVVASEGRLRDLKEKLQFGLSGKTVEFFRFDKQITREQIAKVTSKAKAMKADVIIGVGGGKIADTVKVSANEVKAYVVIVPTVSASDASTSAAALIYNDQGIVEEGVNFPRSPDLVLADTEVLLEAPVRLFVSGMGDALSTYIGGKVCQDHYFENHFGGLGTKTALAIAKASYDLLLAYGRQAKIAAETKALTDAFNIITEVNILMSGLGFENNGSASDHCFYFGTLALPDREEYVFHGEGVAFSSCCQLILQGASNEQLDEVYQFCNDVGLPITFDDMKLSNLTEEEYDIMIKAVLKESFIKHHPFHVTYEMIRGAYKTADAIGHLYKQGGTILK